MDAAPETPAVDRAAAPPPASLPAPLSLRPLLLAQFATTFVSSAFTLFVAKTIVRRAPAGGDSEALLQAAMATTFLLGVLPMVPASLPATWLADRFGKPLLLRVLSLVLVALTATATVALLVAPDHLLVPKLVVALMGVQAALFSPAKYGVLPELVAHERLSDANGRLELSNFVAIVTGSAVGPLLDAWSAESPWLGPALLLLLSIVGGVAARRLPERPASGVAEPLPAALRGAWQALRGDSLLLLSVAGSVAFWGLSKLIGQNVLVDSETRLGLDGKWSSVPLVLVVMGVGVGSVIAGRISARKVEMGLLPLGALSMALAAIAVGAGGFGVAGTCVLLALLGLCGGLLLVPLNALLQWRAPPARRGAVIALANVFVYAGIAAGAASAALLSRAGLSTRAIFMAAGGVLLVGGLVAMARAPQTFVRLVLFLLTHSLYRLRVHGRSHVPEQGGALLVPNHVSFVDGLLVIASLDRPVRFLVDGSFFERPLLGRALKWFGAIPISSAGGPRQILRAFREAGQHLDDGHLVCIFAEGQITRNGLLNPFRRGLERIAKGRSAPILPVHLDGVWGSIFSYAGGRFVTKLPERIPYPVQVSFGEPLPSTTPIHAVRAAVSELGEAAWRRRAATRRPLHHAFLRQVRRAPWRLLFADQKVAKVSRLRAAAGAIALARALREPLGASGGFEERVGVLLPPSIGAALANLALACSGRTSINLNWTAGTAAMESAVRQSGLRHVLTSAEFLAKAKIELPAGTQPLFVDVLLRDVSRGERLKAALLALFAPKRLVEKACGARRAVALDDLVTILFSSGSTGEPKGVMLSHGNVDANVAALGQAFRTIPQERILGVLPLFHSFGFTATLWFPCCQGFATIFHPSPIDAPAIGALVERFHVTFLLATPTLLSIYLRRVTPAQFGSLRLVLTGAEKLTESLANAFSDQFGIRPLEGYGATECAPCIAVSTHDFRAPGFWQPGWRRGCVGQPAPGVALRVVDPETFERKAPGDEGLLLVRGANVMRGYLGRDDLTAKALRDGWYVTGDLARVDEDGFLKITDRLSRFSKIGGEMVPHGRVEEELHKAAGISVPTFAVTALPDEKKGEKLAVVHTSDSERVPELLSKLAAAGLPNLFLPRADCFVKVDALPVLGTGKLDLRKVKELAAGALAAAGSAPANATDP